jgi:hypothetical protein
MKQVDFNALTHSVTYWLSYQDKIGRGFMIQESALKMKFGLLILKIQPMVSMAIFTIIFWRHTKQDKGNQH